MKSVSDYSFHTVNGSLPRELAEEVVKLWINFAGLEGQEAQRRLKELVMILSDRAGKVIGVSTVVKTYVAQIKNFVYIYRCFILPTFRAPALDTQMIVRTKQYLELLSQSETDKRCVGIMVIVQNVIVKQNWRQAVWLGADMIYIGNTPEGDHIRLGYFKDARI